MVIFLCSVRAKKVSIHGTQYKVGSVIHIGWADELAEFAIIYKIVVIATGKVYFVLAKYVTHTVCYTLSCI